MVLCSETNKPQKAFNQARSNMWPAFLDDPLLIIAAMTASPLIAGLVVCCIC